MHSSDRALVLSTSILCLCFFSVGAPLRSVAATPIYSYIDESGTPTFTNEFDSIPEQVRSQLNKQDVSDSTSLSQPPEPPPAEPTGPSTDLQTVDASGEYRMGEHDTQADAVRLAIEAAKQQALEQVATYLERVTEVREMDVTRDDIRSYTAGMVRVLHQAITTRLEGGAVVVRADITVQIDPQEVTQAIAALRREDSARQELAALRADTERLQAQLDAENRALAEAASQEEAQALARQRTDTLDALQTNGMMSQAWTGITYATPGSYGFYTYPWIGIGSTGMRGWFLRPPRPAAHDHAPAPFPPTGQAGRIPPNMRHFSAPTPGATMHIPAMPHLRHAPAVPRAAYPGTTAPTAPRMIPPRTVQPTPTPTPYQLHPSHFWRPSPPNLPTPGTIPHSYAPTGRSYSSGQSGGGGGRHR